MSTCIYTGRHLFCEASLLEVPVEFLCCHYYGLLNKVDDCFAFIRKSGRVFGVLLERLLCPAS